MVKPGRSASAKRRQTIVFDAKRFKLPQSAFDAQVEAFFTALDCPYSLKCLILYRNKSFEELVNLEINPDHYLNPEDFRAAYAAYSFLRKASFLPTGINRKEKAISTFKDSEQQCMETNRRFSNLASDPLYKDHNVWLLNALTRKIADFLPRLRLRDLLKDVSTFAAFGPGASLLLRGNDTSSERKFREERTITPHLYRYISRSRVRNFSEVLSEICEPFCLCSSSEVTTVPKNAKTDRTIAIEPGWNIFVQKAFGTMIRRKLRRAGYDLDSDEKNRNSALIGSRDNTIATIDFKAASDTISKRVVEEILPYDWYSALDACRSHSYSLDGKEFLFEKFSSMGNGFTFELESLIFVSAALVSCEYVGCDTTDVSIFGDDVTLPRQAAPIFIKFCEFLGFKANADKSYLTGNFRESCGSHYFKGVDVKPYFLKEYPRNVERVYNFANSIRHLAHRSLNYIGCDRRWLELWRLIVQSLPAPYRKIKGSLEGGDGCIHSNFDEALPFKLKHGLEGFSFKALVRVPVKHQGDHLGVLLTRLRVSSDEPKGNFWSMRAITNLRFKSVRAWQWYNFGPWI